MLSYVITSRLSGLLLVCLLVLGCAKLHRVEARGDDDGDNDNDDSGFDDSGYSHPNGHDAEGSHHSPTSSVEDDIDDDDEVDETHVNPVTSTGQMGAPNYDSNNELYSRQNYNYNPAHGYNQFAAGARPDYHGYAPSQRYRRSLSPSAIYDYLSAASGTNEQQRPLNRVRRHSKYIGPVYTYVKTDKHANFKWGVKHKVGKKHYG